MDQLKLEIADLMARAEAADDGGEEDPQALPKEIARREALRDRLEGARRRLEARAKARAEAERADYEAKVAAREKRRGRPKGRYIKPPEETPGADEQSNLSDPYSRLMRKSKAHEYRQAYNAQAVVDGGEARKRGGPRPLQAASADRRTGLRYHQGGARSSPKARWRVGNSRYSWPENQNPRTLVSFQSPARKTPAKPLSTTSKPSSPTDC